MDIVTLFLCGDVMTGRGIDQALANPSDPKLHEDYVSSATEYLRLAEAANGPIPTPVDSDYIWGHALTALERAAPEARIINLETTITDSTDWDPKGINYRMSPGNIACLTAAKIDCCVLANNHVLDWGPAGLVDTLEALKKVRIQTAGAGRNIREAEAPAVIRTGARGRILVWGFGTESSGLTEGWAAGGARPGVCLLDNLSSREVDRIAQKVRQAKQDGDITIASIHWGPNWGYEIPGEEKLFAHDLIDKAGVDLVHGHSSHHAKGIEVYNGKLILYGCGDFLNDYEGISGDESFRGDLAVAYFPSIEASSGRLARLEMVPFQIRNFRLNHASVLDAQWLTDVLTREGESLGTWAELQADGSLTLAWR